MGRPLPGPKVILEDGQRQDNDGNHAVRRANHGGTRLSLNPGGLTPGTPDGKILWRQFLATISGDLSSRTFWYHCTGRQTPPTSLHFEIDSYPHWRPRRTPAIAVVGMPARGQTSMMRSPTMSIYFGALRLTRPCVWAQRLPLYRRTDAHRGPPARTSTSAVTPAHACGISTPATTAGMPDIRSARF
jgi:hypothetical protein